MGNLFRTPNGKLDKRYLRICACYKLLMAGKIDRKGAVRLLAEKGVGGSVVDHWKRKAA